MARGDGRSIARDRGFQYGDGLFETMRVRAGRIRLLEYHLERLYEGCRRLSIPAPRAPSLRRELELRAKPHADAVLKLILTRGPGTRGISAERRRALHSGDSAVRAPACGCLANFPASADVRDAGGIESGAGRPEDAEPPRFGAGALRMAR